MAAKPSIGKPRAGLRVVIVGGGQAGGRLAQRLAGNRALSVSLVCREPHPPYERPPLSKGVLLGSQSLEQCLIWPKEDPAWSRVDLRLGISVELIDRAGKAVRLSDGEILPYDFLVLATGSELRRVSVAGAQLDGIHELRSIDDSQAIAQRFARGKRLVVVGGGFVGLEIAASARTAGLRTSVIEASDRLLARVVPPSVAVLLSDHHKQQGVSLFMGTMVERFLGNTRGGVRAVELSTGQILPCDLAVVGVGVKAETSLASAAGLEVEVGIRVDGSLRTSDASIFACGDAAMFWHPLFEQHVRVEAWQNAEDHAAVIAAVIAGEKAVCDTVPWFWSDQYDLSLQIAGLPRLGSSVVTRKLDSGALILFHLGPTGRMLGATGLGVPGAIGREIRLAQRLIGQRAHIAPATLSDPSVSLKTLLADRDRGQSRGGPEVSLQTEA